MFSKKAIRIISIVLAALMILSVGAVLLQVFAVDSASVVSANPSTGDNDLDYIVPVALIAAAIFAVVICLVLPKLKKKDETKPENKAEKKDEAAKTRKVTSAKEKNSRKETESKNKTVQKKKQPPKIAKSSAAKNEKKKDG